jgi:hypothetical protein
VQVEINGVLVPQRFLSPPPIDFPVPWLAYSGWLALTEPS